MAASRGYFRAITAASDCARVAPNAGARRQRQSSTFPCAKAGREGKWAGSLRIRRERIRHRRSTGRLLARSLRLSDRRGGAYDCERRNAGGRDDGAESGAEIPDSAARVKYGASAPQRAAPAGPRQALNATAATLGDQLVSCRGGGRRWGTGWLRSHLLSSFWRLPAASSRFAMRREARRCPAAPRHRSAPTNLAREADDRQSELACG